MRARFRGLVLALLMASLGGLSGPVSAQETAGEPAPEVAAPPPCGTQPIAIARMQWPSAALLAEIHARILADQFGCAVRVAPGDLAATASSMGATGQPAVAPEMWITRITDIWNPAIKAQKMRQAGQSYAETTFEGWFIPDYVAQAHPDLKSAAQIKDQAGQLGGGKKLRFLSCPADWGCAVINRNLLRAFGLTGLVEVIEPANRFELDQLIAEAVGRNEAFVFYYWQPNAVLNQFAFKPLDLGAYDKDTFACLGRNSCVSPTPSAFPPDPVVIALAEWVFADAPRVASYFTRAAMPLGEMNALLARLNEPGMTVEAIADQFVAERAEIWKPWVDLP